jgi:hypothetical protein
MLGFDVFFRLSRLASVQRSPGPLVLESPKIGRWPPRHGASALGPHAWGLVHGPTDRPNPGLAIQHSTTR